MAPHRFNLTTRIVLRGQEYKFLPDSDFKNTLYVNDSGARATIYKIQNLATQSVHAFKIFRPQYQHSYARANFDYMQEHLVHIPAFKWIADRFIINHADDGPLLRASANEYLENAIVMPWLDYDSIPDIRAMLLNNKLSLSQQNARDIAQSFYTSMHELEQAGFAHGDIASSNILIDTSNREVHIIDIEDMFHEVLSKPATMTTGLSGSQGYRFNSSFSSWNRMADRFATAVVLAELLTLHDTEIHSLVFNEHKETTFTQMEIDLRFQNTPKSMMQFVERKLSTLDAHAGSMFRNAMQANTLDLVPTVSDWKVIFPPPIIQQSTNEYERPATSTTPTLMVFLLDLSRSMWMYEVPSNDGTKLRIQLATAVIGDVISSLLSRCRVGRYQFSDRYHIAIIGYHKRTANLLYSERMLAGGGDTETETFMKHGIAPISMWAHLQENVDNIGANFTRGIAERISLGPKNDEGETHTTQALTYVYNLLSQVIHNYEDCHPPYIMHITDGAATDVGEPAQDKARNEIFERITRLRTKYGSVLLSTAYIGEELFNTTASNQSPGDFTRQWTGVTDRTRFAGRRAEWGASLRQLSSRMPDAYTKQMHEQGYTALEKNTYLFFPGNNPEMLSLAINNAASTGK